MNWYKIFYWVSVADSLKSAMDVFSNIFTWFTVLGFIIFMILFFTLKSDTKFNTVEIASFKYWIKLMRSFFWMSFIMCFITWTAWVLIPTKKDALTIIAGGAVGNFITSDSSARNIPSEVMLLLRDKIRQEIKEVNIGSTITDTLAGKTKDELIQMIKDKK